MAKKYHRIPPEVKAEILKRVKEEGIPVPQAAKDAGIHETTIYTWLGISVQSAPSWSEFAKLQRQNKELFALIGKCSERSFAGQGTALGDKGRR